jgi:hypothetical protein
MSYVEFGVIHRLRRDIERAHEAARTYVAPAECELHERVLFGLEPGLAAVGR